MKKVLIGLALSGLFAVLLVPTTASVVTAAACSSGCNVITSLNPCDCGTTPLPRSGTNEVCDNGTIRPACPGGTTGVVGRTPSVNKCSDANGNKTKCTANAEFGCIWDESDSKCSGLLVTGAGSLINLINTIGNWVFAGLLAVASLFLIYAGFMWITAGGDPQAATKARQMLTNALIGVVVALLARGLVQVIKSVISG